MHVDKAQSALGDSMRFYLLPIITLALGLGYSTSSQASCSGGVGSNALSCSSSQGSLSEYATFIQNDYVPSAIAVVMQNFATVFNAATPGQTGWGQIADTWGIAGNQASKRIEYSLPGVGYVTDRGVSADKGPSPFSIDGRTQSNGANAYVDVYWTGTIATLIDGVTNYIASYRFSVSAAAWTSLGLQGSNLNYSGTGTYNFTATTTPVPGPEAGAGLGALAIGGIALFLRRRAKYQHPNP
ncbi:hypothetical protein [Aliirhizobium smilacinae]|uniref:Uncharacterized protein n=1 Tax=Aliirhizobium smilacinae TaxID=1395944 RepID=A0A5C4XPC8_9HYPH|nr:hypothetical protein [Rhizobium smilacinae]TNM65292.1 hypothetical protein FHP24_03150 [Rhizobium smilacinae]